MFVNVLSGRDLGMCLRAVYENEEDELVCAEKCRYIVEKVAPIPNLIKTILLMKNEDAKREVLVLPIMSRVLLSKFTVLPPEHCSAAADDSSRVAHDGRREAATSSTSSSIRDSSRCWLLRMLKNPVTKEKAVEYLEWISRIAISDYMRMPVQDDESEYEVIILTPTKDDIASFNQERKELFQAIASNEKFILRLFTLSKKDMERAGVTAAVRWALNEAIQKSFIITMVFCDFLFHAVLLIVFRQILFRLHRGDGTNDSTLR